MRSTFAYVLIVTLVFGGGYFYVALSAICPVPISYRLGELDERFNLSREAALAAIADAEAVWEEAAEQELFVFDEATDFTVNFIYDERQAFTEAEEASRVELSVAEQVNRTINSEYTALVEKYDTLQASHEAAVEAYEARLNRYNQAVESYNQAGGAPEDVFSALKADAASLEGERIKLEAERETLSTLVEQINDISEQGNTIVERYNTEVASYNTTYGTLREFTQGTYNSEGRIDIYTYADQAELELVLAHELGHALTIDHVAGSESVMYFLIGEQPDPLKLSEADMAMFTTVCGQGNGWSTIMQKIRTLFNQP
jgi:hypothetical protein